MDKVTDQPVEQLLNWVFFKHFEVEELFDQVTFTWK